MAGSLVTCKLYKMQLLLRPPLSPIPFLSPPTPRKNLFVRAALLSYAGINVWHLYTLLFLLPFCASFDSEVASPRVKSSVPA